ncbi:ATP-binding cassette domain-containing protein [Ktedonosporobacter rubrisoli]|uniref:ATP-binding cassette domain-containing protein n=1 Tax=Ktedonosporobacter rubrisoli TaxID=2509675 RepID=A0A4P6JM14_KTERU|nr:ATP-binding cassette domain-containing protein [Ktedonosporobacter rubrisoli]QBD76278.1 ATP-binding cassette domain-containing protein [Ktedonosporobacter rubrisoli]
MQSTIPIIQTYGLTKQYAEKIALNNVSLQVQQGQIFGLLGENGAGKTTLMRLLLGLQKPSAGEARLFGQPLAANRSAILAKIGALIENPSFYGHLTGAENLEVIRQMRNIPKKRIGEMLELVGLSDVARRRAATYSLGMKQRLAMAGVLLGQPELLILDEPTNGLDPSGIREMREFIKRLPSLYGATVVISSHLLSEVEMMVTHTAILSKGNLLFQGSMEQLRHMVHARIVLKTTKAEAARTALQLTSFQITPRGQESFIVHAPHEAIPFIAQCLVSAGIDILHLAPKKAPSKTCTLP